MSRDQQKFTVSKTHSSLQEGSVVYKFMKYDYGLSRTDTTLSGVPHVSVTMDETGDYPFYSVPESILVAIN